MTVRCYRMATWQGPVSSAVHPKSQMSTRTGDGDFFLTRCGMLGGKLSFVPLWAGVDRDCPSGEGICCTVSSTLTTDAISRPRDFPCSSVVVSHPTAFATRTRSSFTAHKLHQGGVTPTWTRASRALFQTFVIVGWTRVRNRFGLYAVHREDEHARTFPTLHLCLISVSRSGKILLIRQRYSSIAEASHVGSTLC